MVLDEIGYSFEPSYWQNDRVFVPRNYNREHGSPRLSLRTVVRRDGKTIYALVMRQHFVKDGLDVINRTVVEDYAEAAHIIYSLDSGCLNFDDYVWACHVFMGSC